MNTLLFIALAATSPKNYICESSQGLTLKIHESPNFNGLPRTLVSFINNRMTTAYYVGEQDVTHTHANQKRYSIKEQGWEKAKVVLMNHPNKGLVAKVQAKRSFPLPAELWNSQVFICEYQTL